MKKFITIMIAFFALGCSKSIDNFPVAETVKLSYEKLFEFSKSGTNFGLMTALADKPIDYNGNGKENRNVYFQRPYCELASNFFLRRELGSFVYEKKTTDPKDRKGCTDTYSFGTFRIENNSIIFTDSDGKILDKWENVELQQGTFESSNVPLLRISYTKDWTDGKKNALIKYTWQGSSIETDH